MLPAIFLFQGDVVITSVFNFLILAPRGIATSSSVQSWINGERYPAYPLVTGGNINEMADTGKFLVIFVIDENDAENKEANQK